MIFERFLVRKRRRTQVTLELLLAPVIGLDVRVKLCCSGGNNKISDKQQELGGLSSAALTFLLKQLRTEGAHKVPLDRVPDGVLLLVVVVRADVAHQMAAVLEPVEANLALERLLLGVVQLHMLLQVARVQEILLAQLAHDFALGRGRRGARFGHVVNGTVVSNAAGRKTSPGLWKRRRRVLRLVVAHAKVEIMVKVVLQHQLQVRAVKQRIGVLHRVGEVLQHHVQPGSKQRMVGLDDLATGAGGTASVRQHVRLQFVRIVKQPRTNPALEDFSRRGGGRRRRVNATTTAVFPFDLPAAAGATVRLQVPGERALLDKVHRTYRTLVHFGPIWVNRRCRDLRRQLVRVGLFGCKLVRVVVGLVTEHVTLELEPIPVGKG